MAELAQLLGIYRRLIGARIRSQLQYRLSFALNLVGMALITFLDFAMILIIFEQVDALGGWTVAEVSLLYGISCIAFALTDLVTISERAWILSSPSRSSDRRSARQPIAGFSSSRLVSLDK